MDLKSVYRFLLLFLGVCTVAVILLSKAVYPVNENSGKDSNAKKEVIVQVPADVTSQGHSIVLNNTLPPVVATLHQEDFKSKKFTAVKTIVTVFYKTLFRVIISPNAP